MGTIASQELPLDWKHDIVKMKTNNSNSNKILDFFSVINLSKLALESIHHNSHTH